MAVMIGLSRPLIEAGAEGTAATAPNARGGQDVKASVAGWCMGLRSTAEWCRSRRWSTSLGVEGRLQGPGGVP